MKRLLFLLVVGLGLFLGLRAIVRALASDETKIRRLVAEMAHGFDRTRMDPILDGLAHEFEDESSGTDRQTLREVLAYLFLSAKDPTTKHFPYRVEAQVTRVAVERADPSKPTAECDVTARFFERRGETEELTWEIEIAAHCERGNEGWQIRKTKYLTRSGKMIR